MGRGADGPPDPFLLGLGVLNRLANVAEDQPVVCVVDDAQWLDRASVQTLAFVARRLDAEAVGVVFAVRERIEQLDGLAELLVSGLGPDDADLLFCSVLTAPLDHAVRERFIHETRGNPLALLELPRELGAAELAGGFGIQEAFGVPARVEESFQRRYDELPDETRLLMLIAAAEPVGDPLLLWRAATTLGVAPAAAEAAEAAGLLKLGMRVMFRHPLMRSAVYRASALDERRRVHRALATATDPDVDPDRRAWHAAHGAPGPDEAIAAALERSAGRAQARGGVAAAAAFLVRAVELSPEEATRGGRALDAAEAMYLAGSAEDSLRQAEVAERGPINEFHRARIVALRGRVATMQRRAGDAPALLLSAARRLEPFDRGVARDTYRDALIAAIYAGRFANETGLAEVAAAVRSAAPSTEPPGAADELLDAAALLIDAGWAAGAGRVRRALADFRVAPISQELDLHWLFLACRMAQYVWDEDAWDALGGRILERVRDSGMLSLLPMAAAVRVGWELFAGNLAAASELAVEQDTIHEAIGGDRSPGSRIALAAFRGREADVAQLDEATTRDAVARSDGAWVSLLHWSTAVLYNGLGRYDEALASRAARSRVSARPGRVQLDAQRARRGSGALRSARRGRRRARTAGRDGARLRHRLGARRRGARSRGRGRRQATRTRSTAMRLSVSSALGSAPNSRARGCSTASGCAARVAGSTRAPSSVSRTTSSRRSGWRRSPSARVRSSSRQARRCASGRSRHATI